MAGPTVRRIWTLALAVLAAARHASPSPGARALDAHTIEHGGRLYVAVDTLSDEAPRRRLASDDEHLPPFSSEWFAFIAMAVTCVVCAAFAAGLTMGLVALDPMQLQITLHMDVRDCASAHEREALLRDQACALRVLPLIENHHLLLVTLLLVNAGANEALPIFLDALLPSWAAILVSVTGVLIFGEIIPSAIFTGPNQLRIASTLSPLVYALIALASPIAYPLALALDHLLGDGHAPGAFRRQELRAIMKMVADEERADGQQARVSRPSVLVSQTADGQQARAPPPYARPRPRPRLRPHMRRALPLPLRAGGLGRALGRRALHHQRRARHPQQESVRRAHPALRHLHAAHRHGARLGGDGAHRRQGAFAHPGERPRGRVRVWMRTRPSLHPGHLLLRARALRCTAALRTTCAASCWSRS